MISSKESRFLKGSVVARLRLTLLGGFVARLDGAPLTAFEYGKVKKFSPLTTANKPHAARKQERIERKRHKGAEFLDFIFSLRLCGKFCCSIRSSGLALK